MPLASDVCVFGFGSNITSNLSHVQSTGSIISCRGPSTISIACMFSLPVCCNNAALHAALVLLGSRMPREAVFYFQLPFASSSHNLSFMACSQLWCCLKFCASLRLTTTSFFCFVTITALHSRPRRVPVHVVDDGK